MDCDVPDDWTLKGQIQALRRYHTQAKEESMLMERAQNYLHNLVIMDILGVELLKLLNW